MSVAAALFLLSGGLPDTYDLGNLPKTSAKPKQSPNPTQKTKKNGGLPAARFARFVQVRANLREIPEVVSARKPLRGKRTLTLENDDTYKPRPKISQRENDKRNHRPLSNHPPPPAKNYASQQQATKAAPRQQSQQNVVVEQ